MVKLLGKMGTSSLGPTFDVIMSASESKHSGDLGLRNLNVFGLRSAATELFRQSALMIYNVSGMIKHSWWRQGYLFDHAYKQDAASIRQLSPSCLRSR